MIGIEKGKLLSEERSICFIDISKSQNLKDSSESNVDNISSNIRHSYENHVNVKIIREKNTDSGSGISNQSPLKSS